MHYIMVYIYIMCTYIYIYTIVYIKYPCMNDRKWLGISRKKTGKWGDDEEIMGNIDLSCSRELVTFNIIYPRCFGQSYGRW